MAKILANREHVARLRAALLEWYGRHRRDLPWRRTRDPYAIWVSEIMLQQTRVAVVVERYQEFMAGFPPYLRSPQLRSRMCSRCGAGWATTGARACCTRRRRRWRRAGGVMPGTAAELRSLPGVGGYTAAAIASIAYRRAHRGGGRQRGARAVPRRGLECQTAATGPRCRNLPAGSSIRIGPAISTRP